MRITHCVEIHVLAMDKSSTCWATTSLRRPTNHPLIHRVHLLVRENFFFKKNGLAKKLWLHSLNQVGSIVLHGMSYLTHGDVRSGWKGISSEHKTHRVDIQENPKFVTGWQSQRARSPLVRLVEWVLELARIFFYSPTFHMAYPVSININRTYIVLLIRFKVKKIYIPV